MNRDPDLNIRDKNGYTVLMYELEGNRNINIIKNLLHNDTININLKNNNGDTAFDIALKSENKDIIKLFINDPRLNKNENYLDKAILTENINIVKLLLNKNFAQNRLKESIHEYSINNNYRNKIIKLLKNKIDL